MTQIAKIVDPVESVRAELPDALTDVKLFRGETTLVVPAGQVVTVARFLRDTPGLLYNYLSDISAVDYFPETRYDGRFGISTHLYSMLYNRRIRIKTYVPEDEPVVPTLTVLWPAANWLEREIMDMMGVQFEGHPDPRRILMPDDWNGHPQRRDYPLGYETIMFSFNKEEIAKHKPTAQE